MKTVRLTMGQALVRFLDNQYVSFDWEETNLSTVYLAFSGTGVF